MKRFTTFLAALTLLLTAAALSSQPHYGCGGDLDCEVIKPLTQWWFLPLEPDDE